MKFALTRIRFILVPDHRVCNFAVLAVQKMYDTEFGKRAKSLLSGDVDKLTPNEERLIGALQDRFGSFVSDGNPLVVYCGENDYVFIRGSQLEGFSIPCEDCYSVVD